MERQDDKVAVVTGAAQGIGAAVAEAFARAGMAVGVFDVNGDNAAREAGKIRDEGGRAVSAAADVRDSGALDEAFSAVEAEFGGVDVLANIAGIVIYGELSAFSEEDWNRVIGVNLTGTFLASRRAIPSMRERGGGAIVNTASVQAFASQPTVAAYSASKGGIVAMTRTMALDHAQDGIRVNAVAPGSVHTPMLDDSAQRFGGDDPQAALDEWGAAHPIGRLIKPDEIAAAIVFLCSSAASAITGTTLLVDGGLTSRLVL